MMNYSMRINVAIESSGRKRAVIYLPQETQNLFSKPYISVRRMNDRLAFMQWDNKTERGMCAISKGVIQFGVESDVEKIEDFVGEYDVVNSTDNGVVFIKMEDKLPLKDRTWNKKKRQPVLVKEVKTSNVGLSDMLKNIVNDLQNQWEKLEKDRIAANDLIDEILNKQKKVESDMEIYKKALDLTMKG